MDIPVKGHDIQSNSPEHGTESENVRNNNSPIKLDRNAKFHAFYLDIQEGDKNLIVISDDYIVKYSCLNYIASAMEFSNPEHDKLSELTRNWPQIDIQRYLYDKL